MEEQLKKKLQSNLLIKKEYNSEELISNYPPKLFSSKKKLLSKYSLSKDIPHKSLVTFSKYQSISLPKTLKAKTKLIMKEDSFDYETLNIDNSLEWHINFADFNLFGFYGGSLFAQDEIQVAEHPILGSIKEELQANMNGDIKKGPYTGLKNGISTPCLIKGVERRISVELSPNESKNRPKGLYGNVFRVSSDDSIKSAITVFDPPKLSNIIGIEAPKYGHGEYTLSQIFGILSTAYSGFISARYETILENEDTKTIIHTGNWGTGAYGGNKELMALLQILAAQLAHIDVLVYHTFNNEYSEAYQNAFKFLLKLEETDVNTIVQIIEKKHYRWGISDGN
eukprot:gene10802-3420_t